MPLLCCDVGLVSELRLTAGCVLVDLASPAVSGTSVYANGFKFGVKTGSLRNCLGVYMNCLVSSFSVVTVAINQ